MSAVIKLTNAPDKYKPYLSKWVSFEVLEWQEGDPVIALHGTRTRLHSYLAWEWSYAND